MSAHTPGPWHIERSGGGWVREVTNKDGRAICYGSIEDADASLISAAPDMYEALKIARDYMSDAISYAQRAFEGHEETGGIPLMLEELAQVDAALAKAGGQ